MHKKIYLAHPDLWGQGNSQKLGEKGVFAKTKIFAPHLTSELAGSFRSNANPILAKQEKELKSSFTTP